MMTYYKKCRIYGVVSVAFSVLFAFSEFAVAEPLSVFNGKTVVGVQQTKRTISGIVKDATGAIIGATVMEKGSNNGAVTNINGEFTLNVSPGATLVISYIGYKDHVITVDNQDFITISMVEDTQKLNEVVVVGYGTQKKVNLSGAVSSIAVDKITEGRPINNISNALAGMAAGVQVMSSSNQPGEDNAYIRVRGQGTLNSAAPLVLIDGVEASINSVNPQDVATISVLKDAASAAIYGSRAANGVILITTKQGKAGSIKINYNGYVAFESIRSTLTLISNYADYMELINEGLLNSNQQEPFSQPMIDAWKNDAGKNPLLYPNTNWVKETFRPSTATTHTLSVSGGTDKIRFYTSFGYNNDPGVMENTGHKSYNARINIDANVKKWIKIGLQASGWISDSGVSSVSDVFKTAVATTPGMVFRAPDGRYGAMNNVEDNAQSAGNNPLRKLNSLEGNKRSNRYKARFYGTITPFKGFSVTASYSAEFVHSLTEKKPIFVNGWNFQLDSETYTPKGKTSISNSQSNIERNFGDIVARYEAQLFNQQFTIKALVGASQDQYTSKSFSANKQDLLDISLNVLNAATGDASASGSISSWAMRSFFGRINLGWKDKYLAELNLRTDGSSRFARKKRWGYFPSLSAAWRLDQEAFMENIVSKGLNNLKLRVSYGSLGNNSIGNYDAISLYGKTVYVFNNKPAIGMAQSAISNASVTWESTYVTDIGLDFGLFNNRLSGTIDWFNKRTVDILINLPTPAVHGSTSIPKQNSATVTNKGIELSLGWQDQVSDFSYYINGNFTYVKNEVNKYKGTGVDGREINGAKVLWEGYPINAGYMLLVDRIIQTDEDLQLVQNMIDNAPLDKNGKKINPFATYGKPEKGDLLYKDTNNDGIIDKDDRQIVSDGPNPKFFYGLNAGVTYKGIDFSTIFQGIGGVKVYWQQEGYNTPTVRHGYQINKEIADGRWYEGRTDATYPRLLNYTDKRNTQISDFYLENKAFLKIKNIQLGYSLPKTFVARFGVEKFRIYGSLENFFTFTKYKGFDPEVSGMNYPTMKKAVIGIDLTF